MFELLELAKEVLDQVPPLVDLHINLQGRSPIGLLCNHHLAALCQQALLQPVCVKCFIGQQCPQIYAFKQLLYTLKIMSLAWQQNKSDQVPKGICQRQDLGGQTTSTATYGLARRLPFAP